MRSIAAQRLLHGLPAHNDTLRSIWPSSPHSNDPLLSHHIPTRDHESLRAAIKNGTLTQIVDAARVTTSLAGQNHRANLQQVGSHKRWLSLSEENALSAANHYTSSRLLPTVIAVIPNFEVADPLDPGLITHTVDQLWIVRSPDDYNHLRLIAMIPDHEVALRRDDDRTDGVLTALRYEVFHVAGWWARIDPQRLLRDFTFAAGLPWLAPQLRAPAGTSIDAYRCHACDGALVRSPSGYGMVYHRTAFVHQECFDPALESDTFNGLPESDDFPFTVLNFR